jgi:hypothetical protein
VRDLGIERTEFSYDPLFLVAVVGVLAAFEAQRAVKIMTGCGRVSVKHRR